MKITLLFMLMAISAAAQMYFTVATLPACTKEFAGDSAWFVSNAVSTKFGDPLVGGGTHNVAAKCDGKTWCVAKEAVVDFTSDGSSWFIGPGKPLALSSPVSQVSAWEVRTSYNELLLKIDQNNVITVYPALLKAIAAGRVKVGE